MTSLADQDAQARQRIITALDQNLMVQAAAGTGKTTAIINRMLHLILTGACQPQHLVAVTFTRKAAAELRERFTRQLRSRLAQLDSVAATWTAEQQLQRMRLANALDSSGHALVDTIHSFCASLLRQRPVEFGVDPTFGELDQTQEQELRNLAWDQNLAELMAQHDPLIGQLNELGLRASQLRHCFDSFIAYRDITDWPIEPLPAWDEQPTRAQTSEYIAHIQQVCLSFTAPARDWLMDRYELLSRASARCHGSRQRLMALLELFERSPSVVLYKWPTRDLAKAEKARFEKFRDEVARPALTYWRRLRYEFVIAFVRRAVEVYERLKQAQSGLDFTDLLMITARGLRTHAHLRRYFQRCYTHLLVDEFQDTDPIQAEIVALLASENSDQGDWQTCRLRSGSLFIVGDPKQSIYRFRRGDIVTYNRIRQLFLQSGGEVLSLSCNFRSSTALLQWNNGVFAKLFGEGNDVSPPHAPMFAAHQHPDHSALAGVYQLALPKGIKGDEEADSVASFIHSAIAQQLTLNVEAGQPGHRETRPVTAGDFMIIARNRTHLHHFKAALEQRGIPCDVTGSNAVAALEDLKTLLVVLHAVDDAYNPLPYLHLLRSQLFGLSDAELYELKRLGGAFQFTALLPSGLPQPLEVRLRAIQASLVQCQLWLRSLPPATALTKIATHLGLMACAAANNEGHLNLGTLLKAMEMLRNASWQFDSAADLISGLEQMLEQDEIEGISARPPAQSAVRIMNLHKAKGLEAPIVLLVDCSRRSDHTPRYHIARQGPHAQGYMWISEKYADYHSRPVAEPGNWQELSQIEEAFQRAEEDRLLYVATTRAANMLVIVTSPAESSWSKLHPFLSQTPELPRQWLQSPQTDTPLDITSSGARATTHAEPSTSRYANSIHQRWQTASTPTYNLLSIKHEALRGRKRPLWQAGNPYGAAWGTAIHQLLDMASRTPQLDLPRQALAIAIENDIRAADVDSLVAAVQSVLLSDIWLRSQRGLRRLSEVPIDAHEVIDGRPTIVRGVIDLVFQEADGWVIVDYKSDNVSAEDAAATFDYYREQLEQYAHYWRKFTGQPVKQWGIYLTRLDLYCHA